MDAQKKTVEWSQDRNLVISSLQECSQNDALIHTQLQQLNKHIHKLEQSIFQQQLLISSMIEDSQQRQLLVLQKQHEALAVSIKASHQEKPKQVTKKRQHPSVQTVAKPTLAVANVVHRLPHDKEEEKNRYSSAYLAYKSARYDEAIQAFRQQLEQFPEGEYAGSGFYWLAESLLAQQHYDEALRAFQDYLNQYAEGGKLASAMLGKARAELALKRPQARQTLKALLKKFPASSAAEQARLLLQQVNAHVQ